MSLFKLNSKVVILFLISLKFIIIFSAQDYAVDFLRLEMIPGTTGTLVTIFAKLERNDRREICGMGNVTYLEDFGNDFKLSISIAISSLGNDNFVRSPMRIPPTKFCDFVNATWRDFVDPSVVGVTTLPKIPPQGLCPFPKGTYELNCFKIVITDKWPSHVPNGVWRLTLKYTKNEEFVGGYIIYANFYSIK